MKCKVCGGTGTSNTCVNGTFKPCTFCDGTGEYEPFDADVELDKLYPTEQTNEEWFCTLSTEEKAKFLREMVYYGCLYDEWEQQSITENVPTEVIIAKWLKEKHDDLS